MIIFCIDDDSDVLNWLRIHLEANGHKVETADSSAEGIRRFGEVKPDVVFVDLMMEEPDSGITVAKAIREKNTSVPVYLLSSVGDSLCSITDCETLKFNDIIQKPINLKNLLALIQKNPTKQ